jgi:signal transduction histidine kinase
MKINIATKLIIILLLTSLIPLLIAGAMGLYSSSNIIEMSVAANQQIADVAMSDSTEALSNEQKVHLETLAVSTSKDIDDILARVEADTSQLADYATFLYNHADSVKRYPYPSTYQASPDNRMFGSVEPNENSWLGVFSNGTDAAGNVPPETLAEIYLTEFLDTKFRSIAAHNPYAVQLYLNTKSQITRGMPYIDGEYIWIDATKQFTDAPNVTVFDFYYLADETHNPQRETVWTELYWDPAGLGWMVSSIAPVYRADKLMGVVGIDITLGRMIDQVINLQIEDSGFAFLMSQNGQAIAFPKRAAPFLGFEDSFDGEFNRGEQFSFMLTETNNAEFQAIINKMLVGDHGLATYIHPGTNHEYFFAYHPVPQTGWSVGIVVPKEEVIAPALATNQKITEHTATTVNDIARRSTTLLTNSAIILGVIVGITIPIAAMLAKTISKPINALDDGSKRIREGDLSYRIEVHTGDEIEHLATTFNHMADELQAKLEEIETANAELRKLDELKSQFISMASHELRTPLISIQGYVDLLRDDPSTNQEERQQMLNTVSRNTKRLARIVTELLDISKIQENKLILRREPVSLLEIIRDVADEQKPSLEKRSHSLTLDLQPNLPYVYGDRDRIAQVVTNLLGNAIKFTPDGGKITIRTRAESSEAHICVIDNGIGIKAEDLPKLFGRFSTVGDVSKHTSGKDAFLAGGTGLGLSIIKGIVEAHGGTVWVESEFGHGSTFHVALPLASGQNGHAPAITMTKPDSEIYQVKQLDQPQNAAIKSAGQLSVLVIDDEADILDVTRRILADTYSVITAQTGATGLKKAITNQPDLILLDVMMPGISGYDVCKTLKRNAKTKEIPVVIFTAVTEKVNIDKAKQAGADGFVTKPFKKEDLIDLIEGFKVMA